MKKNLLKILTLVFCMALFLTGCATVSDVKGSDGKNIYFTDAQYFGGQVVQVGDYLYYGNGYTTSDSSDFNYGFSSSYANLSRLNVSQDLSYEDSVLQVNRANTSPKGIETVASDKLIGYQNQQMYVLGEYIYFTSANTHKTSGLENDYTKVSLFRVKFNGDDLSELVKNTAFSQDAGSALTLQKGSDGKYYFIIVEPTEDSKYTIKTLQVGDRIGSLKTIVENVVTYAIADNNSDIKSIVYTVDAEKEHSANKVMTIDFATGEERELDGGVAGDEAKLLGRCGDVVFYSYTSKGVTEIYYKNLANGEYYFAPSTNNPSFYSAKEISEITKAGEGYIFISNESKSIMYKTLTSEPIMLLSSSDYSDILFVEEDYLYVSNSTSIKRISTIDRQLEIIIEVSDMVSGQVGYTDEYIYFYSKLGDRELEDEDDDNINSDVYYMYRTDKTPSNDQKDNLQLVGRTIKK